MKWWRSRHGFSQTALGKGGSPVDERLTNSTGNHGPASRHAGMDSWHPGQQGCLRTHPCEPGIRHSMPERRHRGEHPPPRNRCVVLRYDKHLLRSSLVSRHTRLKGESWRVRASDPIGSVQARTVGITAPGVDGVVADKAQTHCPRLERLVPKVLKNRKCLDTCELLNSF